MKIAGRSRELVPYVTAATVALVCLGWLARHRAANPGEQPSPVAGAPTELPRQLRSGIAAVPMPLPSAMIDSQVRLTSGEAEPAR